MTFSFDGLKDKLKRTKRGELLINEQEQCLIKFKPESLQQVMESKCIKHPLINIFDTCSFISDSTSISVLADDDILQVFQELNMLSLLPRFKLAGARKEYFLDPTNLNVGVLTAGGNAPGLDVIVDSLVKQQFLLGTEHCKMTQKELTFEKYPPQLKFYGIKGGYLGLQNLKDCNDNRWLIELYPHVTDTWINRGCSSLHALRTNSYDLKKKEEAVKYSEFINTLAENVRKLNLDILYTIGGNGTLTIANELGKKLISDGSKPCVVVAGPKTMDNDVNFTDVTFGFRTTVDNAINFLRDFHREAETLERIGIVELFGAGSGFVALHSAYASGDVDYVLIPEMMGDTIGSAIKELEYAIKRINARVDKRGHALLVVAEGATVQADMAILSDQQRRKEFVVDQISQIEKIKNWSEQENKNSEDADSELFIRLTEFVKQWNPKAISENTVLNQFKQQMKSEQEVAFSRLVKYISTKTKKSIFFSQPKYLIRATPPNGFDIDLCKYTGKLMVDTALSGNTCCAVHLWQGNYVLVPLETAIAELKRVDTSGYYFNTMREKYLLD